MIERARRVADAVLYEGAFLYPYRRTALKNQRRWSFGMLPPRAASAEPASLTAACLLRSSQRAEVQLWLRFLTDDGVALRPHERPLRFGREVERLVFADGGIQLAVVLERASLGQGYERLRACVENRSESPPRAAVHALHAVHMLFQIESGGHFISVVDPPPEAEPYAALCQGDGLWCAVMGADRARPEIALAAPIILPDFPQLAPESCAQLGDATEIDELLALRIRTLSSAEKREARAGDPWVRELVDRVESLSDAQLLRLHGARRAMPGEVLRGTRVRLAPRRPADAFDTLLAGRTAVVRGVERNLEGEVLLSVTLEDDPGSDLGARGMPGHRFFYGLDEVEVLDGADAGRP